MLCPIFERNGPPIHQLRKNSAALKRTIANSNIAHATRIQGARRSFAGLAGTEDEHAAVTQIAKNFHREIDGNGTDRDGAAGDVRVAPHLFCRAKGPLKKTMQQRPGAAGCARPFVGFLHLAQDLRFADHHRIEPRDDSKQMFGAGLAIVPVKRIGVFHFFCAVSLQ